MYVMLIFALALLSPLPFVSPFASVMQDATAQSQFSSFDVDPTSSTVQPLAGPAFALASEVFETEPTDRYEAPPSFYTMSIFEYIGGKVAALAFVIEIGDLNGGKLLSPHKRISLVVY